MFVETVLAGLTNSVSQSHNLEYQFILKKISGVWSLQFLQIFVELSSSHYSSYDNSSKIGQ